MGRIDEEIKEALVEMKASRRSCGTSGFGYARISNAERWLRHLVSEVDRMGRASDDACDVIHGLRLEVARLRAPLKQIQSFRAAFLAKEYDAGSSTVEGLFDEVDAALNPAEVTKRAG